MLHDIIHTILEEINNSIFKVDKNQIIDFIKLLDNSDRLYLRGKGRSALVSKQFAMRLLHLDYSVFIVGSVTAPPVKEGDLVIFISGSGSLISNSVILDKCNELNATTCCFTSNPDSYLGSNCDLTITVFAGDKMSDKGFDYSKRQIEGKSCSNNNLPLGTLFELTVSVLFDAIIAKLMILKNETEKNMKKRHFNLE
ncbi:MAG: SIS domain-containing protein [Methanobrevibacter sp.]|jgi:6-phospho 3-hexuloisomerase|nr:SIS domain-containing protein [Methanobrevibacter sp.]